MPDDHSQSGLQSLSESPSLGDRVYTALRDSIVSGRFAMGERIYENRLAKEMGISRAPIREALTRLAQEQVIVDRPRRGMIVREFSAEDVIDLYNTRIALEQTAIRLATRQRVSTETLRALIAEMDDARRESLSRVVDAEARFHETLVELGGNGYLTGIYRSLSMQIRLILALDDAGYADLGDVPQEHEPMVAAIESGDEERAAEELRIEILRTIAPLIRRLGGDPAMLIGMTPELTG
jgi:DNA-binding GntR family transcriptional regulator